MYGNRASYVLRIFITHWRYVLIAEREMFGRQMNLT